jgi:hypothetical protein
MTLAMFAGMFAFGLALGLLVGLGGSTVESPATGGASSPPIPSARSPAR